MPAAEEAIQHGKKVQNFVAGNQLQIYCKIACSALQACKLQPVHKALLEFNAERLFEFFVARGLAKWSRVHNDSHMSKVSHVTTVTQGGDRVFRYRILVLF